tara:strand:- start:2878 stop:3702 length:825 start_codon:yes stop_codon:yes gene_type:complete
MLGLGSSLPLGGAIGVTGNLTDTGLYLLDSYSGAAAAYSLRLLDSTYSGSAIRVRKPSDNSEQDVGFTSGDLDTTSMLTFLGGEDGFVTVWYDQSGSANNAVQAFTANQPQIVSSGVVILDNGKPAMTLAGDSFSVTLLSLTQVGYFGVNNFTYASSTGYFGNVSTNKFTAYTGTAYRLRPLVSDMAGTVTANAQNLTSMLATTSNATEVYDSGALVASGANASGTTALASLYQIGGNQWLAQGKTQEFILYDSDETANRTGIETNINDFYTIY